MLIGMSVMLFGSIACLLTHSIFGLMIGRFIQGVGAGSGNALWRSIFRDKFSGADLSKYGAYAAIIVSFFVPAAPVVGSFLSNHFGWRSLFIFMTCYTLVIMPILVFIFQETHPAEKRSVFSFKIIKKSLARLFHDRIFTNFSICSLLIYGTSFSMYIVLPVYCISI